MDTEKAILTAIYTHLTSDSQLSSTCSGVRLGLVWAKKDETFPYLVHRLQSYIDNPNVMYRGDYYLDLWDHRDSASKIYDMRSRIIALLDRAYIVENGDTFTVVQSDGEMSGGMILARLWLATGWMIPEDIEHIWHYSMLFTMRFTRAITEITNLT